MKLFISWSGTTSRELAEVFRSWVGMVLQQVVPFVSNADIDKGARWAQEIDAQLQDARFGVLMLTADNRNAPWLLYEAGALSKQVCSSRVSCLLLDLNHADVEFPLALFQNTVSNYEDVFKLVISINRASEIPLDEVKLQHIFDKFWPDLERELDRLRNQNSKVNLVSQGRPIESKVDELLELVRGLRLGFPRSAKLQDEIESLDARKLLLNALSNGKTDNLEWPRELTKG